MVCMTGQNGYCTPFVTSIANTSPSSVKAFILIFFRCSGNDMFFLNAGDKLKYQTDAHYTALTIRWKFDLALNLYVSMGVSGGHPIPAVIFIHAFLKICPLKKSFGFTLAQLLGAMTGSASIYGLFFNLFDAQKLKLQPDQTMMQVVGRMFCTYPNIANSKGLSSEFINTMSVCYLQ